MLCDLPIVIIFSQCLALNTTYRSYHVVEDTDGQNIRILQVKEKKIKKINIVFGEITEDNNSVNLVDMADDKVITIIDQEDKNTTVVQEEGSPPIVKKSMRTNVVTGDVKSDNQVFRIETEFTEITIRVVEK